MAAKDIFSRIQLKHDLEINWNKAINFIPKSGEIIIYDPDDNYAFPRIKIGDGSTLINNLSFNQNVIISESEPVNAAVGTLWINPSLYGIDPSSTGINKEYLYNDFLQSEEFTTAVSNIFPKAEGVEF